MQPNDELVNFIYDLAERVTVPLVSAALAGADPAPLVEGLGAACDQVMTNGELANGTKEQMLALALIVGSVHLSTHAAIMTVADAWSRFDSQGE